MAKHPKPVHGLTAAQFDAMFQTENDCISYLVARSWPEGGASVKSGIIVVAAEATLATGIAEREAASGLSERLPEGATLGTSTPRPSSKA